MEKRQNIGTKSAFTPILVQLKLRMKSIYWTMSIVISNVWP